MATTIVQTGLATLLAVLFAVGHPSAPILTVIVFGNGICAGLGFPAFQAILPDLVPVEDLPGRDRAVVGAVQPRPGGRPVLAGVVIALGGYAWAEAVNAASFFAVIAVLLTLVAPAARRARTRSEALPLDRRGLPVRARTSAGLRVNAAAMCLNTFLAAPFIALVPAMAVERAAQRQGRHVGPDHRAGHRRGRDGAARSARSCSGSGPGGCSSR